MTYSIIRDTLILTYLFYYLHKKMNKTNGQTRSVKVKIVTYFGTEGVGINTKSMKRTFGVTSWTHRDCGK